MNSLVTNFLEVVADSSDGVKKLRALILQLAVSGKLVPQERSDEVYSPMNAPDKLIDVTFRRKETSVNAEGLSSTPFVLPVGWRWYSLNEVTELITDGEHQTPPRTPMSEVMLVTAKNVRDGIMDYAKTDFVTREVAERCWKRCKPKPNDILMVCVGATTGRLTVLRDPSEFVLVRSVALIRCAVGVCVDYVALALKAPYCQTIVWQNVKQSAQPCLYLGRIKPLPIPMPPLNEQHRIVAKVNELMELCDQLELQQSNGEAAHSLLVKTFLDGLVGAADAFEIHKSWKQIDDQFDCLFDTVQSIALLKQSLTDLAVSGKLFGSWKGNQANCDSVNVFSKWRPIKFADVCVSSFYGPRFAKSDYSEEGVPTIRTTDMTEDGRIELTSATPRVKVLESKVEQYRVLRGDLLITRTGSIGTMAVFDSDYLAIPSAYLIRFRLSKDILPEYAYHVLTSSEGRRQLGLSTTKMAQPNINAESIKRIRFSLPPVQKQREILDHLKCMFALIERLRESLDCRKQLREQFSAEVLLNARKAPEKAVLATL